VAVVVVLHFQVTHPLSCTRSAIHRAFQFLVGQANHPGDSENAVLVSITRKTNPKRRGLGICSSFCATYLLLENNLTPPQLPFS